jgi:hypothetical protein
MVLHGTCEGMRSPIRWWRDRRDEFRELESLELQAPEFEGNSDVRNFLEEIAAADARGGPDEVFEVLEKRYDRRRDDVRFGREGRQLRISVATMILAGLTLVATVIGIMVTLATR